jgi:CheY-like chemotaxis protein
MNRNPPRRILVIDDDESIREMIALILDDQGLQVCTARDGHEALALIAQDAPDLILLDMKMAHMDGWQFASRYRALTGQRAPLVVITAARDAAERAAEIAADGYLAKPFDLDDLLRVIDQYTR